MDSCSTAARWNSSLVRSGGAAVNAGTLAVGTGGTGLALSGDVFVDAVGTLAFDLADDLAYDQSLSGTGAVTKAGPGTVTFGGSSPFTGTVTINGGSLVLADVGGGDLNATDVIVNAGGTFQFRSPPLAIPTCPTRPTSPRTPAGR